MKSQEQEANGKESPSASFSSPSHCNCIKKMKTRDLPNLTQCHSCGFRTDSCFGENIKTLYSEWRIVLLCKTCFAGVESSNICSYCLKECSSDNCFHCRQCKHIVHRTCLFDNANVAPFLFSSSTTTSSQLSICLDCWIPKSIAAKRTYISSNRKDFAKSRRRLLQDVVRDANFDPQRKVETAARARELAVEKALAARKAAQLARTALDLVGDRDDNAVSGVDDFDLALRLHIATNCSPMILKNLCSVSSHWLAVPGYGSSINLYSFSANGINDVSIRPDAKDSDAEVQLKEGEESCSSKLVNTVSQSRRERNLSMKPENDSYDLEPKRYLLKYTRKASADRYVMKYKRKKSVHETFDAKTNRYLITYVKRSYSYEGYKKEPDRFLVKYTRRRLNQRPVNYRKSNCIYEPLPT